jgi:hypothetical protein
MNWLRTFSAKRKAAKGLSGYVSTEMIDEIVRCGSLPPLEKKEARSLEFIWLWLRDDDANSEARVSRAIELGGQFGAFTETIFPPVITLWFGAFPQFEVPDGVRSQFVEASKKEFGSSAKLYHGRAAAMVGIVGSKTRFTIAVMTGWRSALLSDLCALEFGQYREYESKLLTRR